MKRGIVMSVCLFIASNRELKDFNYSDGENYIEMDNYHDISSYTSKKYTFNMNWHGNCVDQIMSYIKDMGSQTDEIELGYVWDTSDEITIIKNCREIKLNEFTATHLIAFEKSEIWSNGDNDTATFYFLKLTNDV